MDSVQARGEIQEENLGFNADLEKEPEQEKVGTLEGVRVKWDNIQKQRLVRSMSLLPGLCYKLPQSLVM